jgi:hypothetical protein
MPENESRARLLRKKIHSLVKKKHVERIMKGVYFFPSEEDMLTKEWIEKFSAFDEFIRSYDAAARYFVANEFKAPIMGVNASKMGMTKEQAKALVKAVRGIKDFWTLEPVNIQNKSKS